MALTKIDGEFTSPDFAGQNIATTGSNTAGSFIPTSSTAPVNGVYLAAANKVAIATNSTGKIFIDSSGRVGIGTSSPNAKLHIAESSTETGGDINANADGLVVDNSGGNTGLTFKTPNTASSRICFGDPEDNNAGQILYNHSGNSLAIDTSGSERMRIDSSGNVGIGTTSPNNYSGYTALTLNHNTIGSVIDLEVNGTRTGTFVATVGQVQIGSNTLAVLRFDTSGTERMRIDSSGNVGIGTSAPNYQLHVTTGFAVGAAGFNQQLTFSNDTIQSLLLGTGYTPLKLNPLGGNVGIGTTSVNLGKLEVKQSATTHSGGISVVNPADNSKLSLWGSGSVFNIDAIFTSTGSYKPIAFRTGNGERMRIDSSGRVLIGTTTEGAANEAENVTISGTGDVGITLRSTNSAVNRIYFSDGTSGTSEYAGYQLYNHSSNAMIFGTNAIERLRIDSSGRLLVGTTTAGSGQLTVASTSHTGITIRSGSASTNSNLIFADAASGADVGIIQYKHSDDSLRISVNNGERMRIHSAGDHAMLGDLYVLNVISKAGAGTTYQLITGRHSGTSTTNGTNSFLVHTNGNVVNTNNSYGSLSDVKLKENIVDANSQWSDIKALQVRNYNFIEGQTHTQIGVVAQEVELVSPGLVSESPDRDEEGTDLGTTTKSVNYSVLYMKAVKALQEAMDRIETLETQNADLLSRVTALEG